jgi:putative heme-binding domain-containing protein
MLKTGRGSPAGLLIYHDTRLPEHYRGLQFYPDVFRKLVRAYKVRPAGATFEVTHEFELIKVADPPATAAGLLAKLNPTPEEKARAENAALFRPCQMVTGPDGAVYVCDWRTDSGGAGKLSGDGKNGRIYRLTWAGTTDHPALPPRGMDSWAKIVRGSDADLVKALSAPDFSDRLVARNELVRRGERVRKPVIGKFISGSFSADGRLAAMGVLQSHWDEDVEDLFRLLLNDESADVRRLAADGLGQNATRKCPDAHDALVKLMADDDPAVRRVAALAVARVGNDGTADALVNAWKADDGKDAFLTDAYLRGLEHLGRRGIDALLAVAESGDNRDRDRVAVAFTALRTKPAADALLRLIANPHLLPGQRADLVRSYANYQFDPPLSFEPLADFLAGRPAEAPAVQVAALEVFAGTGAAAGPKAGRYVVARLDAADDEVRAAAVRAVEEARLAAGVPKLLAFLADSKRPPAERVAALKAVRVAGDRSIAAPLQDLLGRREPATLKVEVLRSLAAVDAAAARTAARGLLDQPDPGLLAEAVAVLGATKDGAKLVGERFVAKQLPRELWPRVSEALKRFDADPALARLNADVTKGGLFLSNNPAELQKVRQQVLTKGDPKRGKDLYLNSTVLACVNCHQMEGVGGAVGPDLTRAWDTQTVDKLLEAIVQPSKEIKEGYQSYKVTTADGQVFTGLRVSETGAEVVLRDAAGRDVRLAKADVEEMTPSKVSLMPDDVISQLSYDQFIDLLAFLKSRNAQESLRGAVREYAVAVGFEPDLRRPQPPERVAAGAPASPGDGWQTKAVDAAGVLQLSPLVPAGKASAAYALTYVYSPRKQRATAVLAADDPVRLWVGRAVAFERSAARAGPAGADEKFAFDLPAGWSPVLVKLLPNGSASRLGLTLVGDGLRIAGKPDGK